MVRNSLHGSHLVGPMPAKLPVGIMFFGRPFAEPTLLRIASAYEAATKHRIAPPLRTSSSTVSLVRDAASSDEA